MAELSTETKMKVENIMEEIRTSDVDFDTKEFYQQKIIQAKACANGSKDKIDDMSKVLLNQSISQVRSELRFKKNVSELFDEKFDNLEKKLTEKFEAIFSEKFKLIEELITAHIYEEKQNISNKEDENTEISKKDAIIQLSLKLVNKLIDQSPVFVVFICYVIFEKIGWEKFLKIFGF